MAVSPTRKVSMCLVTKIEITEKNLTTGGSNGRKRRDELTLRDVRNEGTSGDVHQNKGDGTNCLAKDRAFYTKMHQLSDDRQESCGFSARKCTDYAINRGEVAPTFKADPELGEASEHAQLKVQPCTMRARGERWNRFFPNSYSIPEVMPCLRVVIGQKRC